MAKRVTAARAKPRADAFFPDGGRPTWEIAYLFPAQGSWTEADYWALEGLYEGVPRVELANGHLDVLPMPTELHQFIMVFLFDALRSFVAAHAPGVVFPSGMQVRLKKDLYRDPDVVYMRAKHARRRHKKYWDGADLIMEVVSPDPKDRERDWEIKPKEYARAGIPEYWIIDPERRIIRVLTLKGRTYRIHGDFGPGDRATSVLLPGFSVSVDAVLAPPGSSASD
jgi:Uma2 family endonuclease